MKDIDKIEELINDYVINDEITFYPREELFNEFKSRMLQLLLPWRDFDKEKPLDDSKNVHNIIIKRKIYWLYESDLLATLPQEET